MTTYTYFTPSNSTPFQFQATLDGAQYNIIVTWSLAGQRWYINVVDLNGNLILSQARIGSPNGYDLNMLGGYFNSTLIYRVPTNQFEVSP